jgi:hypothetical protein
MQGVPQKNLEGVVMPLCLRIGQDLVPVFNLIRDLGEKKTDVEF